MTDRKLTKRTLERWLRTAPGSYAQTARNTTFGFMSKERPDRPCSTVTASPRNYHWSEPRLLNAREIARIQSFPEDYNFDASRPNYVMGMSVPPLMIQRVALHAARLLKGDPMELPKPHTGPWRLSQIGAELGVPKHGLKVFSCFCCGGGSTMGYKLAGFDVLGGLDIDEQMGGLYILNHRPRHFFLEGIQTFKDRADLPPELFELDVLDGSPPCSSFSMAGNREDDWGKQKQFREGQADQVLDDLFFHFIALAARLQPKMVIAENVKGLILGNARGYVKEIFQKFREAGYETQLFVLNASRMGVPQRRERTFFIARRADLGLPKLSLDFDEPEISAGAAIAGLNGDGKALTAEVTDIWRRTPAGKTLAFAHPKGNMFGWSKLSADKPCPTIVTGPASIHWAEPRYLSGEETRALQSFPEDYDFGDADPRYVCGMSVPPLMAQRVGLAVGSALLSTATADRRPISG